MAKPWSWKVRLTIAGVVLVMFCIVLFASSWGNDTLIGWCRDSYESTPESERRTANSADYFLKLAYFRGHIIESRPKVSMDMYKEFLGLKKDKDGHDVFVTHKLNGLCSENGDTGWGPMHPLGPDAFMEYMELYEPDHSRQMSNDEYLIYYKLFYDWARSYSKDHKPHPLFKKHWEKVLEYWTNHTYRIPEWVDRRATLAPPCEKAQ